MTSPRILLSCILALAACLSCNRPNSGAQTASANEAKPAATAETTAPAPAAASSSTTSPAPKINPARAFQYVKEYVAIGSRPPGSPGHAKADQFIKSHLPPDHHTENFSP